VLYGLSCVLCALGAVQFVCLAVRFVSLGSVRFVHLAVRFVRFRLCAICAPGVCALCALVTALSVGTFSSSTAL